MVNANTEIRKLTIGELNSLARSLSPEAWKILMASIKVPGSKDIPRFSSEDVRLIEEAGKNQHRPAAEVFLAEWCTMGKTRPTVGSMIQLLVEVNLLRAADYLAVDILKENPPERPREGPAAAVDLSKLLEECDSPLDESESEFCNRSTAEADFNGRNYLHHISSTPDDVGVIEMNFVEGQIKNVENSPEKHLQENSDLIKFSKGVDAGMKSDLIKFSSDIIEDTELRGSGELIEASNLLPSFSLLGIKSTQNKDSSSSSFYTETSSSNDSSGDIISRTESQTDSLQSSDFNLPAMSQILPDDLKPESVGIKVENQEIDPSVISENVEDLPVTVLEFFNR
ncbi:protein Tube [Fopius arisanus]|uniref:Protein Tube n=1 Tax=Fopius arisanus TaxID=64838 RepID=A0A9R1TMK2_9HYME|nr:PREDICTED: protein Tube [Fopius arisanus]